MSDFNPHPLITHSQYQDSFSTQPILWDIREPPEYARYPSDPWHPLSHFDLAHSATTPRLSDLHITCEVFPYPWPIHVSCVSGITINDVLEAIHSELTRRISHGEWNALSEKQKARISDAFERRCEMAPDPAACRAKGVIRVDCLVNHTWFSGLIVSSETDNTCLLSLRRERQEY